MKKSIQALKLINTVNINESFIKKNKTTNINILLNRVREDKKKILKKKITFFMLIICSIILVSFLTKL